MFVDIIELRMFNCYMVIPSILYESCFEPFKYTVLDVPDVIMYDVLQGVNANAISCRHWLKQRQENYNSSDRYEHTLYIDYLETKSMVKSYGTNFTYDLNTIRQVLKYCDDNDYIIKRTH